MLRKETLEKLIGILEEDYGIKVSQEDALEISDQLLQLFHNLFEFELKDKEQDGTKDLLLKFGNKSVGLSHKVVEDASVALAGATINKPAEITDDRPGKPRQ